jgi:hypothetical protein
MVIKCMIHTKLLTGNVKYVIRNQFSKHKNCEACLKNIKLTCYLVKVIFVA